MGYLMAHNTRLFSFNLSFVLLLTLGLYIFRDVAPLFVKGGSPADEAEGMLLWMKLFMLFEAAVVLPLVTPRIYEPYNLAVRTNNVQPWAQEHSSKSHRSLWRSPTRIKQRPFCP